MADALKEILANPAPGLHSVPHAFSSVIARLMESEEAQREESNRPKALEMLNAALKREGFEAFYSEDGVCYLRHSPTKTISALETIRIVRCLRRNSNFVR